MTIFFNENDGVSAIPYNCIYKIYQHQDTITISYQNGEYAWLDEEKIAPKISVKDIKFENVDLANNQMRDFYKACEKNKTAFFFG